MIQTKLNIIFDNDPCTPILNLEHPLLSSFNDEQLYNVYATAYELGMFKFDNFLYELITEKLIYDIKEHFYKDQENRLNNKFTTIDDIILKNI